ncbi:MAG: helix-turn-helix domain-containing protein [Oscillospiraceae bacterium]|nr:helix-turn-helix domain-containing protein [Oscillospiraceae bacterium]
MTLGEKLRHLRLKTKKTLHEQGRILKVSMNSVYRCEHDIAVPRKSMLKKMADHFETPLDWLLSDIAAPSLARDLEETLLSIFRELPDVLKHKAIKLIEVIHSEAKEKELANGNGNGN